MSAEALRLHRDDLEQLADLIADRLAAKLPAVPATPELLTAALVAARFGVTRDYVYSRAAELGAIRLGDGPRARLRFDPERVAEALTARRESRGPQVPEATPRRAVRRRAPRAKNPEIPLLPVRGADV